MSRQGRQDLDRCPCPQAFQERSMNAFEITNQYIRQASGIMGLGSRVERLLLSAGPKNSPWTFARGSSWRP
jgi:hypothetical protein